MEQKIVKYIQIKNDILDAIKKGTLQPGDQVDSESVLKKKYHVSAITVRKAFNDLISEGYLYGVQGVGTFVAKKRMIRGLTSISFSDELLQQGYRISMQVDSVEEVVNADIAQLLDIDPEQPMVRVCRVRLANDEPIAYQTSYVDTRKLSLKQAEDIYESKSFYKTLAKSKVVPVWVNENYSVREIIQPAVASLMKVKKGTSAFFVKRLAFDDQDEVIEYAETYFNKEWYSVTVNIKV